ncbi:MAG: hypothetical protein ABI999_15440, partial [Acidobacteriota bacterium]
VLRMTYLPNRKSAIGDLAIDLKGFIEFTDDHDGVRHFRNDVLGVDFGTKSKKIDSVILFPPANQKVLPCLSH